MTRDENATPGDSVSHDLEAWMAHLPGVDPGVEAARQRIRRLARLFDRVLAEAAAAHELTAGDWETLSVLQRAGAPHEVLPKQLARTLEITSGTMSLRIDRLTRAGLVEPAPHEVGDGRRRPIRLTEHGRARWRAATDDRTDVEHRLLARALEPDELADLNRLLAQLMTRFESELGHASTHRAIGPDEDAAGRRTEATAQLPE